ncbi:hypothetical protein JR316_0005683 [Psilocybe cubensis]|uniref:Uncharacterized protein n=1 Tax=Psilocybe cubensis TaxID=181762 RepID=A0ACB8GZT4_PSICU|nr:hypothetical protein JR316_0005683 [Psilocybe cubensis]KAH9481163.1 hypothetical protein JR316_0005683 [Psilocybe cubensis]
MDATTDGSPYIGDFKLVPPSPRREPADLDFDNPSFNLADPNNTHTPSYNGSYYNSPFSQHSELSFSGEDINYDILSELHAMNDYEPSDYDAPSGSTNQASSLLMFTQDADYMSPHFSPPADQQQHKLQEQEQQQQQQQQHRTHGSPFDHSSPASSSGDPHDIGHPYSNAATNNSSGGAGGDGRHSRASSVASLHGNSQSPRPSPSPQPYQQQNPQPHPSPRLDVAHSFGNMSVHTPNWGTQPLPAASLGGFANPNTSPSPNNLRMHSPLPSQKPQSPPRLLMPDEYEAPSILQQQQQDSSMLTAVPKINAPGDDDMEGNNGNAEGAGGGGPRFHIVPATPISGGGDGHANVPFQQTLATLTQGQFFSLAYRL